MQVKRITTTAYSLDGQDACSLEALRRELVYKQLDLDEWIECLTDMDIGQTVEIDNATPWHTQ